MSDLQGDLLKFGLQALGYIGLVFGIGMGYQRILDRLQMQDELRKLLAKEVHILRSNMRNLFRHLKIDFDDEGRNGQ